MTDLAKLKTSLTKEGAYKIALVLASYPSSQVLDHLNRSLPRVKIDKVQAKKNLSAYLGIVPSIWSDALAHSDAHLRALTLVGIVFSHYKLIDLLKASGTGYLQGRVVFGSAPLSRKEFTNLRGDFRKLGFVTNEQGNDVFDYDFSTFLRLAGLSVLVNELLKLKIEYAGWNHTGTPAEEFLRLGFYDVLSMSRENFKNWINQSDESTSSTSSTSLSEDDADYYDDRSKVFPRAFEFKAGHMEKKEGTVQISKPKNRMEASLLHNQIQNRMFLHLVEKYGEERVGTEIATRSGTKIDCIAIDDEKSIFYEIKTARTAKACVRQALSQLLEYAYWDLEERNVELVVVSQNRNTRHCSDYLEFIRQNFGIPIFYQQFNLLDNSLR